MPSVKARHIKAMKPQGIFRWLADGCPITLRTEPHLVCSLHMTPPAGVFKAKAAMVQVDRGHGEGEMQQIELKMVTQDDIIFPDYLFR